MRGLKHFAAALVAMIALGAAAAPANAGQAELDRLVSYIGNWSGSGVLVGGESPEPFRCRLSIAKGNQLRINYSGRCSLINMNLSVSGTIAFDDNARRYQAAMSSNAGFTGMAVGKIEGDRISFDLSEKQMDRGGNDVRIGSKIVLLGDVINIHFEVEFNNSGSVLTAAVPFNR